MRDLYQHHLFKKVFLLFVATVFTMFAIIFCSALFPQKASAETPPYVGQQFWGTANIENNWHTDTTHFGVSGFSGRLWSAGWKDGTCRNRTAAAPAWVRGNYVATVKEVNIPGGWFRCDVLITPPDATDGVSRDNRGRLYGYQRVGVDSVYIYETYVGYARLNKSSNNPGITNGNANYSLAGAQYGVYNGNGGRVGTFSTDGNGNSNTLTLTPGNYYTREEAAPRGYALNSETKWFSVGSGNTAVVYTSDAPLTASVSASKWSSVSVTKSEPSTYYNCADIVYTLKGQNYGKTYNVTLDGNGNGYCSGIVFDTYTVSESNANNYYNRNGSTYTADLRTATTQGISFTDSPKTQTVTLQKRASDPFCAKRLNYYNFEGIKYNLVGRYSKNTYTVTLDKNGNGTIPNMLFDNYTVVETASNKYFKLSSARDTDDIKYNDNTLPQQSDAAYYATVEIQKTSDDPDSLGTPYYNFKGIKYKLEGMTSGYVTYVTLNENGWGSTANNSGALKNVPFDRYKITEYETNEYYELNKSWSVEKEITTDNTNQGSVPYKIQASETKDHPLYGTLEIHKSSTDTNTEGTEYYSFRNIVYTITGKTKGKVYNIVLNDTGWGKVDHIIFDTYSIKETVTNKFYELNTLPLDDIEISSATTTTRAQYEANGGAKPDGTLGGGKTTLKPVNQHGYYTDVPHKGVLRVHKSSTNKSVLANNSHYNFEGIVYTFTGREKGQIYNLTLDANGDAILADMVYDTYDVRETSTNDYYKLNDTWTTAVTPDASTTAAALKEVYVSMEDEPNLGTIQLNKISTDPRTLESPYYNFDGIEYEAIGKNYGNVYTFKLNSAGTATVNDMVFDEYTFTETKNNQWYFKNDVPFTYDLTAENTKDINGVVGTKTCVVTTADQPMMVKISTQKVSADMNITNNNGAYSVKGAEYTINCTRDASVSYNGTVITTDVIGKATSEWLPYDDYEIHETLASPGHAINTFVHAIPAAMTRLNETYRVAENEWNTVSEPAQADFSFSLKKQDARTKESIPTSCASLQNAVFKIEYFDTTDKTKVVTQAPLRTWYVKTNAEGKITSNDIKAGTFEVTTQTNGVAVTKSFISDEPYIKHDKVCLPVGVIVVQEVMNPVGYLYDNGTIEGPGEKHVYEIKGDRASDVIDMRVVGEVNVFDSPVSADFSLLKLDAETRKPMANVPFLITSNETGEQHMSVTDTNGIIDTRLSYRTNPTNLNGNDRALSKTSGGANVVADATLLDASSSIFFTGFGPKNDPTGMLASKVKPSTKTGPLPYGTYTVEEVPCASNYGHSLETFEVVVSKDSVPVFDGEVLNNVISLHTTAVDNTSGGDIGATNVDKTTIVDEIAYTNLTPGVKYTMTGTIMDKVTGKILTGVNNETFVKNLEFIPVDKDGIVRMTFDIPVAALRNKTAVVFEELRDDVRAIADHKDINDDGQTVYYTSIKTTAVDKFSNSHEGVFTEEGKATIVDTVEYKNLIVGGLYEMTGSLMNKLTGEPIVDADGKEITTTLSFVPENTNGSVSLSFDVDRAAVEGMSVVVFEELVFEDFVIASHKDLNDDGQTVTYPGFHTVAYDAVSGVHEGQADNTTTINDRVAYINLIAGKEYKISGVLMDKDTGKTLVDKDGNEFRNVIKFVAGETTQGDDLSTKPIDPSGDKTGSIIPDSENDAASQIGDYKDLVDTTPTDEQHASGFVVVPFDLRGTDLTGKTVVCYERLYLAGEEIDEDITTEKDNNADVNDENKNINKEVMLSAETDKPENENVSTPANVENEKDKELDKKEENIEPAIKITDNDLLLIFDEDINNREETVWYPSITTEATVNDEHEVVVDTEHGDTVVRIIDTVFYKNLEPGQTYKVSGLLMERKEEVDKADTKTKEVISERFVINEQAVSGEAMFVPTEANGEVNVEFVFDVKDIKLGARKLVAFEQLYKIAAGDDEEPVLVASHEDIDDKKQTIRLAETGLEDEINDNDLPLAFLPDTGDMVIYLLMTGMFVAIALSILKSLHRKHRR